MRLSEDWYVCQSFKFQMLPKQHVQIQSHLATTKNELKEIATRLIIRNYPGLDPSAREIQKKGELPGKIVADHVKELLGSQFKRHFLDSDDVQNNQSDNQSRRFNHRATFAITAAFLLSTSQSLGRLFPEIFSGAWPISLLAMVNTAVCWGLYLPATSSN